jgi:peptide/nickel transport system substrate-binding protein
MITSRGSRSARCLRMGAAVAVALLAAAGCAAAPQSGSAGEPAPLVSSLPPAKGEVDLIRWNLSAGEPDTLFPPNAATYSGGQVVANLCDSLVTIDADYNLKPNLATPQQVDPLTLVYTIRDGAAGP